MSDIFDEINEDLRADRARILLRRYGALLAGMALLAVLGAGAWQGWAYYQSRRAAGEAQAYLAAARIADAPEGPQRMTAMPAFARLAKDGDAGYRALARLRMAALDAGAGDGAAAARLWNEVAADPTADQLLRDAAALAWTTHQLDSAEPAALAARLAPLAEPANPFHAIAQEQQGLLAMRQGQTAKAAAIFKAISADLTAPSGVRSLADALLTRLGGQARG